MGKVHRLPILRLPFLALEETIGFMDIVDRFALSKVSKRCQRIVKYVKRKLKYEVILAFNYGALLIKMRRSNKTRIIDTLDLKNSEMDRIEDIITHLTNTFAVDNVSLHFYGTHCTRVLDIVQFVKELGMTLGSVVAEKYGEDDELCEFILRECNIAKSLEMVISTYPKFSIDPSRLGPFQCDHFSMHHASWFTMNHVISWLMNCKDIKLYRSTFSSQGLNRFLKIWMQGSSIEHLKLSNLKCAGYSLNEVLNDIPAIPARAAKLKDWLGPANGFIVQQKSGLEVFVYQPFNDFFKMTTEYELEIGEENR